MSTEHIVLAAYAACLTAILVFSLSAGHLALATRRERADRQSRSAPSQPHPRHPASRSAPHVTLQLPIYNELHVAERVIDAACRLDYPADRLCVQVLDDSTDGTKAVIDAAAARHRTRDIDVVVVRRGRRDGYKAGALAHGLTVDSAEFLLVLDADFVPQPDLISRLLPPFEDPRVAAVQARWGYLNEDESLLTAVQAFLLGLHFRIEQPGRAATGGMLNFNGTAGMWRRTAVLDAGGWSARTVTEDVDLSYRAQLRGWRIAYLDDVVVPSELPADMAALRVQQHRWIRGGAQNARLHVGAVLRQRAPWNVRWHAVMHLLSGSLYAVILAMLVLSVPLTALKGTGIRADYTDWALPFAGATAALGATLGIAHEPRGTWEWVRFTALLPAFLVLTLGLALHNGHAALRGLLGPPGGEFVRTAKSGGARSWTTRYAARTWDRRVAAEMVFGAWLTLGVVIGVVRGENAFIPLQLMALTGLGWVVTLSLVHPWRVRHGNPVPTAVVWPPACRR